MKESPLNALENQLLKKSGLFSRWRQSSAMKSLAKTQDPKAAEIMADAIDAKHPLSERMVQVLSGTSDPAWIDRLCNLWARKRQPWLGNLIMAKQWIGQTPGASVLCALKVGRQAEIGTDPASVESALSFLSDKDGEITSGVLDYAGRLNGAAGARAAEILAAAVDAKHPLAQRMVQILSGTTDPALIDRLCNLWAQKRQTWLGNILVAKKWIGNTDGVSFLCALKVGRQGVLGTDPASMSAALHRLQDNDPQIVAGALAYAARLPNEVRANDAIYDAWITTQIVELEKDIAAQRRQPSSVAKETLFHLASGQIASYLALNDANGTIFREGWQLAGPALRQRISAAVVSSGNSRLIDAYTSALGERDGFDPKTAIEARKTAGDEDGLFEACRSLTILDLLDICTRWAGTGRLPSDPTRKRHAENALAAWRQIGKIEFDAPAPLPPGLIDFFDDPGMTRKSDADLQRDLQSPDPLLRLQAAATGRVQPDLAALAKSSHWPDRLAARLLSPTLASATNEHVAWTSLAGGLLSHLVLTATAEGSPTEHEQLLRLEQATRGKSERISVINHGMAGVLLAFQGFFQRGGITSLADDSASERGAFEEGGAASPEDLEF